MNSDGPCMRQMYRRSLQHGRISDSEGEVEIGRDNIFIIIYRYIYDRDTR